MRPRLAVTFLLSLIGILIWEFSPETTIKRLNSSGKEPIAVIGIGSVVDTDQLQRHYDIDEKNNSKDLPLAASVPVLAASEKNLQFLIDAFDTTPDSLRPSLYYQIWRLAEDLDTQDSAIVALEYFSRAGVHGEIANTYLAALNNSHSDPPETTAAPVWDEMILDRDAGVRFLAIRQFSNRRSDRGVNLLLKASYDNSHINRQKTLLSLWQISMDNPDWIIQTRDRFEQAVDDENRAISALALAAIRDIDALGK